jgi:uncharacterized membrane protein
MNSSTVDNKKRSFLKSLRVYIVRGFLALIPLGLSLAFLIFLYSAVDKRTTEIIHRLVGVHIPGLGIVTVLLILLVVGYVTSNIVGRQLFGLVERVTSRIPLIRTTYHVGKQLSAALSMPERKLFERVVLLEYFRPNVWTVGFVIGTVLDTRSRDRLLKVFVPTVPNPTSGFLVLLPEAQAVDPGWTVEEGVKAVISGGIISPETVGPPSS